jgi:hypothetical protein
VVEARAAGKAVSVYEFETWCNDTGYLYPAMAAFFREMGAQIATMWEYDPEPAAPYNFAASHFFNLRHTPEKAVSFVVAREVFKNLPRVFNSSHLVRGPTLHGGSNGGLDFAADFTKKTSWVLAPEVLAYSNSLPESLWEKSSDPDYVAGLQEIWGVGNSSLVKATGNGAYHLVRDGDGWKLTVYPNRRVEGKPWTNTDYESAPEKRIFLEFGERDFVFSLPGMPGGFVLEDDLREKTILSDDAGTITASLLPGQYRLDARGGI